MKKCIRCGNDKEIDDFYVHPQTKDGHLNKCKKCCKEQADLREKILRKDADFCEKERLRSKEKYHRLNYKDRQYECNKLKVYKTGKYKNLFRDLKLPPDKNAHHWNYDLIEDVIILDKKFHRFLHRYLILNESTLLFETVEGNILNSKEKHLEFIEKIKLIYCKLN